MDPFERLRRRLARDDAVSEVVSYTLMFAMGATALTFSMEMLVDAQERGADIATAKQVNQLGQATATLVQDAARAAHNAPNATFSTKITLPDTMAGRNYTIRLHVPGGSSPTPSPTCPTNAEVHVASGTEDIDKTVRLGNLTTGEVLPGTCLVLDTSETVSSSDGALRVRYERAPTPTITLDSANR